MSVFIMKITVHFVCTLTLLILQVLQLEETEQLKAALRAAELELQTRVSCGHSYLRYNLHYSLL